MDEILHYLKFKNFSKDWEKYVFHWKKLNFGLTGNCGHAEEYLILGKTLNIYFNYLMFYPRRQDIK